MVDNWEDRINDAVTAWRLEQQPSYAVDGPPTDDLPVDAVMFAVNTVWPKMEAGHTRHRVRIVENPPTDYQAWSERVARLQRLLGEQIETVDVDQAHTILGPDRISLLTGQVTLPDYDQGPHDFWLLNDSELLVLLFDDAGKLLDVKEGGPQQVESARSIRDSFAASL